MQAFDHSREIAEPIPPRALLLLVAGLILVTLPFLGSIPVLGHLSVLALAIWRYRIQITGGKLPPAWVRISLFLVAVGTCFVIYGAILNMEAATFLLLILVGLKLLEMRSRRDFSLIAWLCTFLVLAALFFTSSLPLFLYQLMALLVIFGALIAMSAGMASRITLWAVYGRTLVVFLQALPLIVGLYLLFPRFSGGPFASPLARQQAVTGMSDSMNPGSFATLVRSEEPVMRVSFPQSNIPRPRDLYWRAQVFWDCDGFGWEPGIWLRDYTQRMRESELRPPPGARTVLQRIILEPHNERWLFALDRPVSRPSAAWGRHTTMKTGQFLILDRGQRVTNTRQYDVLSYPVPIAPQVSPGDVYTASQMALPVPGSVPSSLRNLAWQLSRESFDAEGFVREALEYFARGSRREVPDDTVIQELARPWLESPMTPRDLLQQVTDWAGAQGWIDPADYSRKLEHNSRTWTQRFTDSEAVLEQAMQWFDDNNFLYTTSPGTYSSGWAGVEQFLLQRRRGFCEHYAGAFGALMRLSGVPSRVVVGYQGGTFNRLGGHLLVRQSDAHAWNEVYLQDKGWQRVDLTTLVASDRLEFGMEAWTELERVGPTSTSDRVAALNRFSARGGIGELLRNIEFAWDAADYYWNVYILSYDDAAQTSFLSFLQLDDLDVWQLISVIFFLILGIMLVYLLIAQRLQREPEATEFSRDYRRLLRKLENHGLTCRPTDGPLALSEQARRTFPGVAEELGALFHTYIRAVYSRRPLDDAELRTWRRRIRNLRIPRQADSRSPEQTHAQG